MESDMKQLLKGGTVVSGSGCVQADVLIEDGKITAVAPNMEAKEAAVTDVAGRLLFPGFIDAHTHFDLEVSGTVTADNFETGTKAAVSGGTTMILDFATQYKGETLHKALENWHEKADGNSSCDYGYHLAVSDWNEAVCEELESIIREGVSSFKVYMTYDDMVLSDKQIYQVLERLKEVGGIVGVHCENKGIIDARIEEEKAKGHLDPAAHPVTRPAEAEAEAIDRLLKIAALVDIPVMVVHLSTALGYEEVEMARAKGQKVYLETCPQYLLLDDSCYQKPDFEGSRYVCSPPLRKEADHKQLWKALAEDRIQTISTDHCSFTTAQKERGRADFTKIPNGMPGVETRPVLLYTYGVRENRITLEQMCRLLSEQPAKLYGMYPQKGCIAVGSDADIVVWNPECSWTLTEENQVADVDYSPFEGFEVKGKAEKVFLRGILAAEDGKIVEPHRGAYVKRGKPGYFI